MLRTQWRQEPEPPCSRTSGGPSPQTRQTMLPSPQGVSIRRAAASIRASSASGASGVLLNRSCIVSWVPRSVRRRI